MSGRLDISALYGIERAVHSAATLTAGGHDGEAREDAERAFELLGLALGLDRVAIAGIIDVHNDYESAREDNRVVSIAPDHPLLKQLLDREMPAAERAALLDRLVEDTEPLLSADRDSRALDMAGMP